MVQGNKYTARGGWGTQALLCELFSAGKKVLYIGDEKPKVDNLTALKIC